MSASREVLLFEIFWKGLLTSKMAVFPTLFYSLVPTFLYTQACSLKNIPLSSRASLCSPLEPEYPFPAGETVKKKLKLCLDCSNVAQNAFLDSWFFFQFCQAKVSCKTRELLKLDTLYKLTRTKSIFNFQFRCNLFPRLWYNTTQMYFTSLSTQRKALFMEQILLWSRVLRNVKTENKFFKCLKLREISSKDHLLQNEILKLFVLDLISRSFLSTRLYMFKLVEL